MSVQEVTEAELYAVVDDSTKLLQVAVNNEVMVAISNKNYAMPGSMLTTWMEGITRAGVKNAMVVALDDYTKSVAESHGIAAHEMHLEVWSQINSKSLLV